MLCGYCEVVCYCIGTNITSYVSEFDVLSAEVGYQFSEGCDHLDHDFLWVHLISFLFNLVRIVLSLFLSLLSLYFLISFGSQENILAISSYSVKHWS